MSGQRFTRSRCACLAMTCAVTLLLPKLSRAEQELTDPSPSMSSQVQESARLGAFLPLTLTPSVGPSRALAAGFGGYDTALGAARIESFAEARVFGKVAFRFGASSRSADQTIAPSVTGRVQLLSQANHGLDGALSLSYKAEGFSEPEGELEIVAAAARSFGAFRLVGNVAYGQDPEGNERDAEARAAVLYQLGTSYVVGMDARGRVDLGSDTAKLRAHHESTYDVDVGPVLTLALGPIAIGAHGGLSIVRRIDTSPEFGVIALGGLGTAL